MNYWCKGDTERLYVTNKGKKAGYIPRETKTSSNS